MIIDILARSPPAICIAGGIYSYLTGNEGFGVFLVIVGAILQFLWI
jgi:hypothetical protein